MRSLPSAFWHVVEANDHLLLLHYGGGTSPWINYSVVVEADLAIILNLEKTAVKQLGRSVVVPSVANSKRALVQLLESDIEGFVDLGDYTTSNHKGVLADWEMVVVFQPYTGIKAIFTQETVVLVSAIMNILRLTTNDVEIGVVTKYFDVESDSLRAEIRLLKVQASTEHIKLGD
ncbi:hypothetical protein HPB50_007607 [Hyalomma asiaticum]|uniref:Uncharacterized protein n=1 Tax=Hyalomma asiaticum TaxID=266040 RepID=A0ACB7RYJ0_HYAAI|nr:hypothetical protein HPB50_007607 [Hyalomma asiaticum]